MNNSVAVEKSTPVLLSELFIGSDRTHGVQDHRDGEKIVHWTKDGPATVQDCEDHWNGSRGLGIVPVKTDGTCHFAAIDIDVDTINHQDLYERVRSLRMPLTVCRSKSGGAHLYLFSAESRPASLMRSVLRRWAGILQYPQAEIFPKQDSLGAKDKGNWINLPYFAGENTTRYAVGAEGALTFEQFFASISFWDGRDEVKAALVVLKSDMPPCLQHYFEQGGFKEGERNDGLFNVGIFYRKAQPNGWQDQLREYNQKFCNPALDTAEVGSIIRSIENNPGYNYRCDQPPINAHCDLKRCKKMPYGVNGRNTRPEFLISHLRKIKTDPPTYVVEVNGLDVSLTDEEFMSNLKFRRRLENLRSILAPPMKDNQWDEERRRLHETEEVIEAPEDASTGGAIMDAVMDFLTRYKNARGDNQQESLLKGMPIEYKDKFMAFKSTHLWEFLTLHRQFKITRPALYALLHAHGATCEDSPAKILGKSVRIWLFPKDKLNIQTEDYAVPEFPKIEEEM